MFKDLHKSPIFIGVLLVTAGLQVREQWLNSDGHRVCAPAGVARQLATAYCVFGAMAKIVCNKCTLHA